MALIEFTDNGLFCPQGNFYLDPWKPVERAVITHAHSDHARWGSKYYLCTEQTKPILQLRLGDNVYETLAWAQPVFINGVSVSFYPSGHIIGAAQVRLEYKGEVWVFTGDFKVEDDGISNRYEPVRCNVFITESTFGLPIFKWKPQAAVFNEMKNWVMQNHAQQTTSILIAYSLGKAQRILLPLAETGLPLYGHGAVCNINETLIRNGWNLPPINRITPGVSKAELAGAIVIAPPGADGSVWMKRFTPYATGICSGWMQVRGNVRRRNPDAAFALSDHADWPGLVQAVTATGAEKVFTTHGFQSAFSRYLNENGIESAEVKTAYGNEEEEEVVSGE